jgi:DNA-binding MarR family transcriptional regulator
VAKQLSMPDLGEVRALGVFLDAFRRMDALLEEALQAEVGVSRSWFDLLLGIAAAPDQRLLIGELGRKLSLTSGGVTRFVDRVEAAGLVTREPSATDRRALYVAFTDKGRRVLSRGVEVNRRVYQEAFADRLTRDELSVLSVALPKIGQLPEMSEPS